MDTLKLWAVLCLISVVHFGQPIPVPVQIFNDSVSSWTEQTKSFESETNISAPWSTSNKTEDLMARDPGGYTTSSPRPISDSGQSSNSIQAKQDSSSSPSNAFDLFQYLLYQMTKPFLINDSTLPPTQKLGSNETAKQESLQGDNTRRQRDTAAVFDVQPNESNIQNSSTFTSTVASSEPEVVSEAITTEDTSYGSSGLDGDGFRRRRYAAMTMTSDFSPGSEGTSPPATLHQIVISTGTESKEGTLISASTEGPEGHSSFGHVSTLITGPDLEAGPTVTVPPVSSTSLQPHRGPSPFINLSQNTYLARLPNSTSNTILDLEKGGDGSPRRKRQASLSTVTSQTPGSNMSLCQCPLTQQNYTATLNENVGAANMSNESYQEIVFNYTAVPQRLMKAQTGSESQSATNGLSVDAPVTTINTTTNGAFAVSAINGASEPNTTSLNYSSSTVLLTTAAPSTSALNDNSTTFNNVTNNADNSTPSTENSTAAIDVPADLQAPGSCDSNSNAPMVSVGVQPMGIVAVNGTGYSNATSVDLTTTSTSTATLNDNSPVLNVTNESDNTTSSVKKFTARMGGRANLQEPVFNSSSNTNLGSVENPMEISAINGSGNPTATSSNSTIDLTTTTTSASSLSHNSTVSSVTNQSASDTATIHITALTALQAPLLNGTPNVTLASAEVQPMGSSGIDATVESNTTTSFNPSTVDMTTIAASSSMLNDNTTPSYSYSTSERNFTAGIDGPVELPVLNATSNTTLGSVEVQPIQPGAGSVFDGNTTTSNTSVTASTNSPSSATFVGTTNAAATDTNITSAKTITNSQVSNNTSNQIIANLSNSSVSNEATNSSSVAGSIQVSTPFVTSAPTTSSVVVSAGTVQNESSSNTGQVQNVAQGMTNSNASVFDSSANLNLVSNANSNTGLAVTSSSDQTGGVHGANCRSGFGSDAAADLSSSKSTTASSNTANVENISNPNGVTGTTVSQNSSTNTIPINLNSSATDKAITDNTLEAIEGGSNTSSPEGLIAPTNLTTSNGQPHQIDYTVSDAPRNLYYDFHETLRDTAAASGSYRVLLPDNRTEIVTYNADNTGYHPVIEYENIKGTPGRK